MMYGNYKDEFILNPCILLYKPTTVKTTALSAQSGTGFSNNPEHVEPKFQGVGRDAEALSVIAIQIYQRMPQLGIPWAGNSMIFSLEGC